MPRVSQTIPAMFDGISQQPAALRRTTQCEDQENVYSTVADGAMKRPPSQFFVELFSGALGDAFIHTINRDTTERYIVLLTNSDIKVYDLADGSQKVVATPNGVGYLSTSTPSTDFACVTVADHTFILNKNVEVALEATLGAGTLLGTKQRFSDLPTNPSVGDIWEIKGDNTSAFTSYYVKRGAGVWEEWKKPGIQDVIDGSTMPHKLVRESDGTFTFLESSWDERIVGDETSAPSPTFVGRTVRDLFFHRNRLGMLADENVIMSGASDYFNFWPGTVLDVLDSAPIDVAVTGSRVSLLNHAVSFDKTLMTFSDQDQFALNAQEILSPTTAAFNKATSFEAARTARPVSAGPDLFFATEKTNYAAIRNYYVEENAVSNDAEDITAHASKLIPAGVDLMVATSAYDMLFVRSSQTPNTLYVYQYMWQRDQGKVQSAWTKWTFGDAEILSCAVLDDTLVMVNKYSDGVVLEHIKLEPGLATTGMGFTVHLDRQFVTTGVYSAGNDWTTFSGLPFQVDGYTDVRIVKGQDATGEVGTLVDPADVTIVSSHTVRVPGDLSGHEVIIGLPYDFRYVFSQLFYRGEEGAVLDGRLQVKAIEVYFKDTGYFGTKVTRGTQEASQSVVPALLDAFNGRTVGSTYFTLGTPAFATGAFKFPVMSDSRHATIELNNDSHLGCAFMKAEWAASFVPRNRRR